jgi:hypothetical protein
MAKGGRNGFRLDRLTAEDSAIWKDRIAWADGRLEAWARWQGTDGAHRLNYPRSSSFARVMTPADQEQQAGARHVAMDATDDEAMQIDAVVSDWKVHHRNWFRVARKEYMTGGPSEKKARELSLSRSEYGRLLDALRADLWKELANGGRNDIRTNHSRVTPDGAPG